MTTPEMHVWVRQYAQQMGMQLERVLLPEQIDLLINTSIMDVVQQLINDHIALTGGQVLTNAKLGQVNALRTLLKTATIEGEEDAKGRPSLYPSTPSDELYFRRFINGVDYEETELVNDEPTTITYMINGLHLTSLSINYDIYNKEENKVGEQTYGVRLIDSDKFMDSYHDTLHKPTFYSPIAIMNGLDLRINLGAKSNTANGFFKHHTIVPSKLIVSYIARPRKVSYANNINCDLPDSLHIPILKHAMDLNNIAIRGSLFNSQSQQQTELQQGARANAAPNGEQNQQQ